MGNYGERLFKLKFSPEFCTRNIDENLKNGLVIEFGHFTTNNWHKNHLDLTVIFNNIGKGEIQVLIIQAIEGDDNGFEKEEYILSKPYENEVRFRIYEKFV